MKRTKIVQAKWRSLNADRTAMVLEVHLNLKQIELLIQMGQESEVTVLAMEAVGTMVKKWLKPVVLKRSGGNQEEAMSRDGLEIHNN